MSNMSYCRFENTARDLYDCVENWDADLSLSEANARLRILKHARMILAAEGIDIDDDEYDAAIARLKPEAA